MVCDPEFSGTKVRYGCNSYDPSGTAGYHIRAYWTSGCDKQNHRKRLVNRPRTSQILFGDNFSTMVSGLIGSVPTTTYGENIGVMAVTKVYSVRVIGGAAVLSIICSFVGKLSMMIQTIPGPVIGGISFLLYGMIGASGLRILVDSRVDYGRSRNLMLTSIVFVTGLSGISVNIGTVSLTGMVLACVVAMALSLIFYILDKLKLTNDREA